ncbi:hypothetical protein PCL_01313 [Purpureocillium lilacinum]|uniref:DUF455 domain protein n=1 Tax=Purpureocillium lilacinum TaxID=33203 RepID=A0A2U3E348_PURLI|nr:hypothetical protein PCL_01313 [Purpureocillium lilacinum]
MFSRASFRVSPGDHGRPRRRLPGAGLPARQPVPSATPSVHATLFAPPLRGGSALHCAAPLIRPHPATNLTAKPTTLHHHTRPHLLQRSDTLRRTVAAAMQGFNMGRYVPPDVEGTTTGNRLHGKRPASVPTVRFEMPFAVWCASCPKPTLIGQGVRFNAQKRRSGAYHSTPIWSFRFRHADCGGAIEIRTDPQNTAYVVVEGGTRRDTGEDKPRDGDLVLPSADERDQQEARRTAFSKLERTIEDREQLRQAGERIAGLLEDSARRWDDPYAQNQRLRRAFRAGRKQREKVAADDDALRERMSLGIDLLPGTDDDARRAALVDFGPDSGDESGGKALSKPLFTNSPSSSSMATSSSSPAAPHLTKKRLKADVKAAKDRDALVSTLVTNTRAAKDPFLQRARDYKLPPPRLPVKRKRPESESEASEPPVKAGQSTAQTANGLVDYDSD